MRTRPQDPTEFLRKLLAIKGWDSHDLAQRMRVSHYDAAQLLTEVRSTSRLFPLLHLAFSTRDTEIAHWETTWEGLVSDWEKWENSRLSKEQVMDRVAELLYLHLSDMGVTSDTTFMAAPKGLRTYNVPVYNDRFPPMISIDEPNPMELGVYSLPIDIERLCIRLEDSGLTAWVQLGYNEELDILIKGDIEYDWS